MTVINQTINKLDDTSAVQLCCMALEDLAHTSVVHPDSREILEIWHGHVALCVAYNVNTHVYKQYNWQQSGTMLCVCSSRRRFESGLVQDENVCLQTAPEPSRTFCARRASMDAIVTNGSIKSIKQEKKLMSDHNSEFEQKMLKCYLVHRAILCTQAPRIQHHARLSHKEGVCGLTAHRG